MLRAVEVLIDEQGHIKLLESIKIKGTHRGVLTILDDVIEDQNTTALLSEASLAKDWDRPEEDEAWKHLQ